MIWFPTFSLLTFFISSRDITKLPIRSRKKSPSFFFQFDTLFNMPLQANISYGPTSQLVFTSFETDLILTGLSFRFFNLGGRTFHWGSHQHVIQSFFICHLPFSIFFFSHKGSSGRADGRLDGRLDESSNKSEDESENEILTENSNEILNDEAFHQNKF